VKLQTAFKKLVFCSFKNYATLIFLLSKIKFICIWKNMTYYSSCVALVVKNKNLLQNTLCSLGQLLGKLSALRPMVREDHITMLRRWKLVCSFSILLVYESLVWFMSHSSLQHAVTAFNIDLSSSSWVVVQLLDLCGVYPRSHILEVPR